MVSQCQRFYGGADPLLWFDIPVMYLQIFHGNIAPLAAAERLQEVTTIQVARAETEEGQERSKQIIDLWTSMATSGQETTASKNYENEDEFILAMAMFGIPVDEITMEH